MDNRHLVQISVVGHPTSGKTTFIKSVVEVLEKSEENSEKLNF